jgi:hypothetical protein
MLASPGDRQCRQQMICPVYEADDLAGSVVGRASSWPDVLADLNSLTETEVEKDRKRYFRRGALPAARRTRIQPSIPDRALRFRRSLSNRPGFDRLVRHRRCRPAGHETGMLVVRRPAHRA